MSGSTPSPAGFTDADHGKDMIARAFHEDTGPLRYGRAPVAWYRVSSIRTAALGTTAE